MAAAFSAFTRFYFDELTDEQIAAPSGVTFIDIDKINSDEYEDDLVSQNIRFTRIDFY